MSLTIIDNNNIFQKDVIGNVRTAQEDCHDIAVLTPNGDVFVVCDGMGGHVGGKQASSIAVRSIIDYLKKEKYPQPKQALNDALQFANMQILGYANEHPELSGMGTTACVVLLQASEAYIAHVGDSRIYLYLGKEKQLHRVTKDHSFVQTLVDAGQITDEEAEHHPNKNRILKALGVKSNLEPTIGKVQPKNGDIFLICSDGLSGMISDSEIRDVLMQNTCLENKGKTLINLALEAGGSDNITLELVQIANSPHSKSVFRSYNSTGNNKVLKGMSKVIKWLIITLISIVVCVVIGSGVYICVQNKINSEKIERLNKEIEKLEQDSIDIYNSLKKAEIDYNAERKKADEAKKDGYNGVYNRCKRKSDEYGLVISKLKKQQGNNQKLLEQKMDSLKTLNQNSSK